MYGAQSRQAYGTMKTTSADINCKHIINPHPFPTDGLVPSLGRQDANTPAWCEAQPPGDASSAPARFPAFDKHTSSTCTVRGLPAPCPSPCLTTITVCGLRAGWPQYSIPIWVRSLFLQKYCPHSAMSGGCTIVPAAGNSPATLAFAWRAGPPPPPTPT